MGRGVTLDTILNSAEHFLTKWSTGIESNKSGRILRYIVTRLYTESDGDLHIARLKLAQKTLATKLGMSRQWVNALAKRLQEEGWLEHYSPKVDGMNGSSAWRIGRQMQRLIVMLNKSPQRPKKTVYLAVKKTCHFSPLPKEIEKKYYPPTTQRLSSASLIRMPELGHWLKRGGLDVEKYIG